MNTILLLIVAGCVSFAGTVLTILALAIGTVNVARAIINGSPTHDAKETKELE